MLNLNKKQKAEIHADDKRKMEYAHVGSIRLKKGQKLYEYNLNERVLKLSDTQMEVKADMNGKLVKRGKKTLNPLTMYVVAINEKNACRKLYKRLKAMNNKNKNS